MLPAEPAQSKQYADPEFTHAATGKMSLMDLIGAAERWAGQPGNEKLIALYRMWLANTVSPLAYAANFNLGSLLSAEKDFLGAERAYRKALEQNPLFPQAMVNLGTALEQQGRISEALDQWRTVVKKINPKKGDGKAYFLHAINNLGRLLEMEKKFEEAEEVLTKSLLTDPDQPNVITHWVHLRQKQCKWPAYSSIKGVTVEALIEHTSTLAMLSASGDPQMQLDAARRFVKAKVDTTLPHLCNKEGYAHDKLRIGYLSSDFCSHAVSILTAELYELHDRDKVDVYGFCWSREDGSPLRARVVNALDNYIRIGDMSDEQAARCILSHEIDILIDLQGLTSGARPNILMYRPAPLQVTYLGFPGPTALPEIDYVIADTFVFPAALKPYFTEKPLYMPNSFQINDRQRAISSKPTRAACHLPEDAFVFCSFNNNFKFTAEVFAVWMNILKAVPDSVLWLVSDHDIVRTNLWHAAEKQGVARERVIFADRVPPDQYLARYQVADLFLDTFTFNAGTTASDALWAGLPLLTYAGRTFASRMAGSLLHAVGLPQLITTEIEDYQRKAIELAKDRPQIEAMKRQLEENRLTCSLFDSPQFVRDLESVLASVAIRGKAGSQESKRVAVSPAGKKTAKERLPLVSILMPTHQQPEQLAIALKSAMAQQYLHLEIIICDTSSDERTKDQITAARKMDPRVRYERSAPMSESAHAAHCLSLAGGEYVNFLYSDDELQPQKIATMAAYMMRAANIGLISSHRQIVGADGKPLNVAGHAPIFSTETIVGGISLGDLILGNAANILGAASAILFRRDGLTEPYGSFAGRSYTHLSDIASWLSILSHKDCVYLPEPLSTTRLTSIQAMQARHIGIAATIEWLQLYCDAHEQNKFLFNRPAMHTQLTDKLIEGVRYLSSMHEEIKAGAADVTSIQGLVAQATRILLAK